VEGDELKVRCKYCSCMLNAKYLPLLRHSLSNKHLSNAAAASTMSFPVDVDSCEAPDASAHLSQDEETVTDGESDESNMLAGESANDDSRSSNVQHFDDDLSAAAAADNIHGRRKVSHYVCVVFQAFIAAHNLKLFDK